MKTIEIIESISMDYFPLQIKSFNSHQYKKDDYYYIANELKKNNFILNINSNLYEIGDSCRRLWY